MEFGKVSDLEPVDWTLPEADVSFRPQGLASRILLGTPAWGHREWVGKIYPAKTPASDYLTHYARNFGTIELNTTHYRIPDQGLVERWRARVPEEFLFCPKISQGISHGPGGLLDRALREEWVRSLGFFGAQLGPSFLQLPPSFDYSRKAELFHFLRDWPDEKPLAIEFRHGSWFTPARMILPALGQYLRERSMGLVITDVAGRRDLLHGSVTAPFALVRFIGNGLHPTDFSRLADWAVRLKEWREAGVERVFFFLHQPDDLLAPEIADHAIKLFNEVLGAGLEPLAWSRLPGFS